MPKCQKLETKDAKATLVISAFGSKDAKMASYEITEAKVTSEISYDAAFWAKNYHDIIKHPTHLKDKRYMK